MSNLKGLSQRYVDNAIGAALASDGIGKRNSYRVGAVLFNRNGIISARHNSRKTHPKLAKFTEFPFLHAESSCILHAGLDNCSDSTLLVVRVLKDGRTLSCAKPCDTCMKMIDLAGISKVYYSDWNGEFKCL